jgi:hypothetical protein
MVVEKKGYQDSWMPSTSATRRRGFLWTGNFRGHSRLRQTLDGDTGWTTAPHILSSSLNSMARSSFSPSSFTAVSDGLPGLCRRMAGRVDLLCWIGMSEFTHHVKRRTVTLVVEQLMFYSGHNWLLCDTSKASEHAVEFSNLLMPPSPSSRRRRDASAMSHTKKRRHHAQLTSSTPALAADMPETHSNFHSDLKTLPGRITRRT